MTFVPLVSMRSMFGPYRCSGQQRFFRRILRRKNKAGSPLGLRPSFFRDQLKLPGPGLDLKKKESYGATYSFASSELLNLRSVLNGASSCSIYARHFFCCSTNNILPCSETKMFCSELSFVPWKQLYVLAQYIFSAKLLFCSTVHQIVLQSMPHDSSSWPHVLPSRE